MDTKEIWKPIKGYEGLYEVSNLGRVKSLERYIECQNGHSRKVNERILKIRQSTPGSYGVVLYADGYSNTFMINRLVIETFGKKLQRKDKVIHIDGNNQNNVIDNLRWESNSEWNSRLYREGKVSHAKGKFGKNNHSSIPVLQFDKNGKLVKGFAALNDAARETGISASSISSCATGRKCYNTAGGFIWKYKAEKQSALEEYVYPIGGEA